MAGPIPREEALRKGGADLRFTLSRNDVDDDLQAAFFTNGITTIQKFSSFFRSEDDLIEVMRDWGFVCNRCSKWVGSTGTAGFSDMRLAGDSDKTKASGRS